MPWCPECKYEYVPGIERCADCGSILVEDDPNQGLEQEQREAQDRWAPIRGGADVGFVGCLGAILSWVAALLIALVSLPLATQSGDGLSPLAYLQLAICSTVGFSLGIAFRARFMPSLIGWLLVSTPFLVAAGIGYAHDESISIPAANLIWLMMFLPILLGPLSIAAGSHYARDRRGGLALCLVPTALSMAAVYTASRVVGLGK